MSRYDGIIEMVEAKGWSLYDTRFSGQQKLATLDQLQARGPTTEICHDVPYFFAPQPAEEQTLREAFISVKGIGASLRISNVDDPKYGKLELFVSPNMAFFSRIVCNGGGVMLFTPQEAQQAAGARADLVGLRPEGAVETFAQDFTISTPEEFQQHLAYGMSEFRLS